MGSKLSIWLVPPCMNSQMTLLARGAKWGRLRNIAFGVTLADAWTFPSRASIVPRTMPVIPMPQSARKERRVPGIVHRVWFVGRLFIGC